MKTFKELLSFFIIVAVLGTVFLEIRDRVITYHNGEVNCFPLFPVVSFKDNVNVLHTVCADYGHNYVVKP